MGADLPAIIDAWPTLPEAIKAGILAMVRAINPDGVEALAWSLNIASDSANN
jgi:hypothetical protein